MYRSAVFDSLIVTRALSSYLLLGPTCTRSEQGPGPGIVNARKKWDWVFHACLARYDVGDIQNAKRETVQCAVDPKMHQRQTIKQKRNALTY
jgi:hypothetical protein